MRDASSLTVTPGGVALASPAITAVAGSSSVMALGTDQVAMNGRKVGHLMVSGCATGPPTAITGFLWDHARRGNDVGEA